MTGDLAPESWGKIDLDSDTAETLESTHERPVHTDLVKKLAKQLFPKPDFDENGRLYYDIMILGKPAKAEFTVSEYERELFGIEYGLTESGVSEEELPEFVGCVSKLQNAFEYQERRNGNEIASVIKIVKTPERAKQLTQVMDHWQKQETTKVEAGLMKKVRGRELRRIFGELGGTFRYPEREMPNLEMSNEILDVILEFQQTEQNQNPDLLPAAVSNLKSGVERSCLDNHDVASAREVLWTYREFANRDDVLALPFKNYSDAINRYTNHLGLTHEQALAFRDHLYPAMISQDENVHILNNPSNSWAMRRGEYSIGEYTCHLYSAEASPQLIGELMLINSEIPTAFAHQFEQNRRDGSALLRIPGMGQLKEAIHDQRPLNHDVIQAMISLYDGKITTDQLLYIARKHSYVGRSETFLEEAIKVENYDLPVEERTSVGNREVPAIDVLRRLAKNTSPIPDAPPNTPYESLNTLLNEIGEFTESTEINEELLGKALAEANSILVTIYDNKQVGVNSKFVIALGYLNRASATVLRNMTFEKQVRAYRNDWFAEMVRFHDLTMNPNQHNPTETAEFIRRMQQEHTFGAYEMLGRKIAVDVGEVGRKYRQSGKERWSEMLWSGNLSHELLGLLDLREPTTDEGKKYKRTYLASEMDRLKGD
jgi:hypothetical protein